jgi:hypothetical protein
MSLKKFTCIIACFLLLQNYLSAQDKSNIKFGKITPADFDLSKYKFDSSASVVIIADIGSSEFEGNNKGWFSLLFKHFKRIKVLNKNGFDAGTIEIPLYVQGQNQEKVEGLKAITYNLDNGKIIETKLDDKSVFTDVMSKNNILKKFTFPNLKEGSIIEYTYTVRSDFLFNLQPWEFQGSYPCMWSEYEVTIPEYFDYVFLGQGYQPFFINKSSTSNVSFTVRDLNSSATSNRSVDLTGVAVNHRWVIKDVPALREENFTSTINNYISKVEFQLSQYRFPNEATEDIMPNWPKACEQLMKDEDFGADITSNNGWLDAELNNVIKGSSNKFEKAVKIYSYVHNNFTCTSHSRRLMDNPLKTIFKNKSGSEAEINLLLVAMLNHEDIQADPVILSTRDNGYTNEIYPLLDRFNYVICSANIDNKIYYLDASEPKLGFGNLSEECYNGHARVINKDNPRPVYFFADSLKESKVTSMFIFNDEKVAGALNGTYTSLLGNIESYDLRKKVSKKSEEEYFKNIKSYNSDFAITNTGIDSLTELDKPATIHYDFSYKISSDDEIIYFNPMMSEAYKENPFKSAERKYPVEMPYVMDEIYVLNMEIPKGYVVDELPKSARVSLNGAEGSFEYIIAGDDSNVQLRTRIKLNKATFEPEDYTTLRDFFGFIVKKQSEQIVFKKKK